MFSNKIVSGAPVVLWLKMPLLNRGRSSSCERHRDDPLAALSNKALAGLVKNKYPGKLAASSVQE